MQLRIVSKEEAHQLIDSAPGSMVMMIQYNCMLGISNNGKKIKKKKSKQCVDRSSVVVLSQSNPVIMLNLHNKFFSDFSEYKRENIVNSILLPRLE